MRLSDLCTGKFSSLKPLFGDLTVDDISYFINEPFLIPGYENYPELMDDFYDKYAKKGALRHKYIFQYGEWQILDFTVNETDEDILQRISVMNIRPKKTYINISGNTLVTPRGYRKICEEVNKVADVTFSGDAIKYTHYLISFRTALTNYSKLLQNKN